MTSKVLIPFLLLFLPHFMLAKSVIEPCNASDSCPSYLSYRLPLDSKISEIAFRFEVNVYDLLAANSIDSNQVNQILPEKSFVKVAILCSCVNGIRRSSSTHYTIGVADTLMSISQLYGGLVSAEQIGIANGVDAEHPIANGQSFVIPLPCTCFNNSNNGVDSVYMSYVVQSGDDLTRIAAEYGVTVGNLEFINGLGQPQIDPGDILAIPLAACSSAKLNWYNESLIIPNGSYALTANNCIKCGCSSTDLSMECSASGIVDKCAHLQCKDSNLFIGERHEKHTAFGNCNVTACIYRGHLGGKTFRSLVNSTDVKCLGSQSQHTGLSMASPATDLALSPSPSPSPSYFSHSAKSHTLQLMNSSHAHRHSKKWLSLLVLELILEILL